MLGGRGDPENIRLPGVSSNTGEDFGFLESMQCGQTFPGVPGAGTFWLMSDLRGNICTHMCT